MRRGGQANALRVIYRDGQTQAMKSSALPRSLNAASWGNWMRHAVNALLSVASFSVEDWKSSSVHHPSCPLNPLAGFVLQIRATHQSSPNDHPGNGQTNSLATVPLGVVDWELRMGCAAPSKAPRLSQPCLLRTNHLSKHAASTDKDCNGKAKQIPRRRRTSAHYDRYP
jgi:hypothetical protein